MNNTLPKNEERMLIPTENDQKNMEKIVAFIKKRSQRVKWPVFFVLWICLGAIGYISEAPWYAIPVLMLIVLLLILFLPGEMIRIITGHYPDETNSD